MSHITKVTLEMRSEKYLIKALEKMGYETTRGDIKDYEGTSQGEGIILTDHPSIGFQKDGSGKISMVFDFYSTGISEDKFIRDMKSYYALALVTETLRSRGVSLGRERVVDGIIEVEGTW